MKVKYDGEGDILDILIKDGQICRSSEQNQVIINYDENGEVIEIEILGASNFLGTLVAGMIKAKTRAEFIEIK